MAVIKCSLLVIGLCALLHTSKADVCGQAQWESQSNHHTKSLPAKLSSGVQTFELHIPDGEYICGDREYVGELVTACDEDSAPTVRFNNRNLAIIKRTGSFLKDGYSYVTYFCRV